MFPYERELLPAKEAENSLGSPLLSLLIFTDSFWWGLFFLGLYTGTKERWGIPQVHSPQQCQHARSSKPYKGAWAASERLVHWCNDSIEGFGFFPLYCVVIFMFVNMLRRHLKFCHLLLLKWYTSPTLLAMAVSTLWKWSLLCWAWVLIQNSAVASGDGGERKGVWNTRSAWLLLAGESMGVTLCHPPSCRLSAKMIRHYFALISKNA